MSGCFLLRNLLISLCQSIISVLTYKELVARKVRALQSPYFSVWLLDFTSLFYVNTIILRDKCTNITILGLIQYVTLYRYLNR